jgi:hypothetical protein
MRAEAVRSEQTMPGQFPPITPTVRTLVVVLVVFFLGQTAAEGLLGIPLTDWAALAPGVHLELAWQWATYWLVALIREPGDVFWHLVSIFVLYWSLSTFEMENGRGRLLALIATGVVGAAIPLMIGGAIFPTVFGLSAGPTAIFYAWLGALPVLRPGVKMGLWIATIPPISTWTLVAATIGLTALQSAWTHNLSPLVEAIGAIGAGVLYGRVLMRPRRTGKPTPPPKKRPGRPNLTVIEGGASDDDHKPRWLN